MRDDPSTRSTLCLWGFMATGKSTVGRALAAKVQVPFVDLDARIELSAGRSVAALFATEGEAAFRSREAVELRAVLHRRDRVVVALGGGALLAPELRAEALAGAYVVSLVASPATIRARLGGTSRPLLGNDPTARVDELLEHRLPYYAEAHASISTEGESLDATVAALIGWWRGWN